MSQALETVETNPSMMNVYNLLRKACGVSQAEAAGFVHGSRLDSVKSWCTDRRTAPQGVINDLQKLAREIQNAGVAYADQLKRISKGDTYIIGLPSDERDARACGFPSIGAQMRSIAIAISYLPDGAEIRMVERVRGSIPAPVLEKEKVTPTKADSSVLASIEFTNRRFYTAGNINRRKYGRLEEIGWVRGVATSISDVEYHLADSGVVQLALIEMAAAAAQDLPDPAPGGFQTIVNSGHRRGPIVKLEANKEFRVENLYFRIEEIEGNLISVKLRTGETAILYAADNLLPSAR